MTSFEFNIAREFRCLTTRESGASARIIVLRALEAGASVTLDFTDARPSPSFADELVGGLAAKLGKEAFLRRVRIIGIDEAVRPLLNRVVATRLKQGQAAAQIAGAPKRQLNWPAAVT